MWKAKVLSFLNKYSLVIVLMTAFVLRLPLLGGSFWLDEAAQALESSRPLSQQLQITQDFQPPLIHVLVHFLLGISHSEWWLRLGASVIPGIITIWAAWKIGERLSEKKSENLGKWQVKNTVGLIAALLLSTSSFHIFYSQELRPYALPAMWATLSWLSLLVAQKKSSEKGRFFLKSFFTSSWIWFTVCSIAGMYSSYLYPFVVLSQLLYLIIEKREEWKNWMVSFGLTGICFLPWVPEFFNQLREGQNLRQNLPGWEGVVSFSQTKSLALVAGKFIFGVLNLDLNIPYLLVVLLLFILVGCAFLACVRNKLFAQWKPFFFLSMWLITPILLAWIVSFIVPVVQPKRVLFGLPAFYLFISYVATLLLQKKKDALAQMSAIFLLALFFIINIFSTFSYYAQPQYQREDWKGMYQFISQKYSPHSAVVIFGFTEEFAPWTWYNSNHFPTIATGVLTTESASDLSVLKKVNDYHFVLVFDYLRDLTDPKHKIEAILMTYGYREVDRITPETPIGIVHVFAKPDSVIGSNTVE